MCNLSINIIGDIHGRSNWRKVVRDDCFNIFVGDYFDPYGEITFEQAKNEFLAIIDYIKTHSGTMLYGNHDLHYFHLDDTSRMDWDNMENIKTLLWDNKSMFKGIAYALDSTTLVSHAGVSQEWLNSTDFNKSEFDAYDLEKWCNDLLWNGDQVSDHYKFNYKAKFSDFYGTSPQQSPVWIRPHTLLDYNALPEGLQIVGHTQSIAPVVTEHLITVDCLGQNDMSVIWNNGEININGYEETN